MGATVTATALWVRSAFRPREIPLGDIAKAELKTGWRWGAVRVRHASGKAVVSGLSRADATGLATALEAARADWWRKAVAGRIETLRSVHERVASSPNRDGTLLAAPFATSSAMRGMSPARWHPDGRIRCPPSRRSGC